MPATARPRRQGRAASRWRLQLGRPTRDYIRGEELRARAELGIDDDVAVLVMNRPLKEALEKQAYQMYTDSLQTSVDPQPAGGDALAGHVRRSRLGRPAARVLGPLRRPDGPARKRAGLDRSGAAG